MRTVYPNKIQNFGVYDFRGAIGSANYTHLTDAQLAFGKPGLLDRVVSDLIPVIPEQSNDVMIFGTNFIKLTLDNDEHLQRIPYNKSSVIEHKICNILGGYIKKVDKDFFGYTGKIPHFYKVFCKSFGPYKNDIEITFNGTVNDSLYIYSGSDPKNPIQTFTNIIPANTEFRISVKNESEPDSNIYGTFNFTSLKNTINLKELAEEQDKEYYLYSYNASAPNIKTKVAIYTYDSLPTAFKLDSLLCYEFGKLEQDLSETESEVINFYLTLNENFAEYSKFTRIPAEYVLLSERIFISKENKNSSWYTWNGNVCTVNHNLNGLIDFNIRDRGLNEIQSIPHKIINNNTIKVDFSDWFNKEDIKLLTDYTASKNTSKKLTDIIQFQLFDLEKSSEIEFYQYVKANNEPSSSVPSTFVFDGRSGVAVMDENGINPAYDPVNHVYPYGNGLGATYLGEFHGKYNVKILDGYIGNIFGYDWAWGCLDVYVGDKLYWKEHNYGPWQKPDVNDREAINACIDGMKNYTREMEFDGPVYMYVNDRYAGNNGGNITIEISEVSKPSTGEYELKLVDSFLYENLPAKYSFEQNIRYRIYARTAPENINKFFEMIIWRVDNLNSKWKKNVFTLQKFNKDEVEWAVYDNEDPLACDLPFRFSILGYSKIHEFINSNVIDTTTINTEFQIEPTYQFNVKNDKIKVLVPSFESKDQCHSIYFYISTLSKTMNIKYKENDTFTEWTHFHGADGYELQTVKLKHNMNGIVKINIRDTRFERYDTFILDNNTIQIVFKEPWKNDISNINVDLYLIRKAE